MGFHRRNAAPPRRSPRRTVREPPFVAWPRPPAPTPRRATPPGARQHLRARGPRPPPINHPYPYLPLLHPALRVSSASSPATNVPCREVLTSLSSWSRPAMLVPATSAPPPSLKPSSYDDDVVALVACGVVALGLALAVELGPAERLDRLATNASLAARFVDERGRFSTSRSSVAKTSYQPSKLVAARGAAVIARPSQFLFPVGTSTYYAARFIATTRFIEPQVTTGKSLLLAPKVHCSQPESTPTKSPASTTQALRDVPRSQVPGTAGSDGLRASQSALERSPLLPPHKL
jgi:hypothetical protein